MTTCPRCGEPLAAGQEYCLVCGARVGGTPRGTRSALRARAGRFVPSPPESSRSLGGAAAVAATGSDGGGPTIVTAIGGFATAPTAQRGETPVGPSGVAEWPTGRGRMDDRARVVAADRRVAPAGAARARRAREPRGSRRSASSTRRAMRASTRATGSSSRASTRPRPRRRARSRTRASSRTAVVRRVVPVTRVAFTDDFRPRLCNTTEKALHSRARRRASLLFRPAARNSGRSSRSLGRPHRPASLLYVSILASDLSLDQGSDRPVRRRATTSSSIAAPCSSSASAR